VKNILPPHSMLNPDPTTFFGLNERIVAAESCWFAAKVPPSLSWPHSPSQILSELKPKVLCLLPEAQKQTSEYFISDFQQISGQLRSLIYRAMCPDLVKQAEVLSSCPPSPPPPHLPPSDPIAHVRAIRLGAEEDERGAA
jgi:hypothetical protein